MGPMGAMGAILVKYSINSQRNNNGLTSLKYEHKHINCCQVKPLPPTVRIPSCSLAVSSWANGSSRVFFPFVEFIVRRWDQWKQQRPCPWMHRSESPVLLSTKPSDRLKILRSCRPSTLFSPDVCSASSSDTEFSLSLDQFLVWFQSTNFQD